jgi:WD40 repeat protein
VIGFLALLGFVFPVPGQTQDDSLPPGAIARLGEVRYRNVGRVFSLAYSPDGKTLVAGAWDGSLRAWDPATGKELRQYVSHSGWVRSVSFAADGKTFASGGKDKVVRLWDTATGEVLRRLEGHPDWVQCLALSPDGKTLASRGTGLVLTLWDVTDGRVLRRIKLQQGASASLAFSPDGKRLAYSADLNVVTLLDVGTGDEALRITRPRSWTANLAFSPDGKILTGVAQGQAIVLWETATGRELRPLGGTEGSSVVFSPDGRSAATAGGDHFIRVWELATRQERLRLRSPDNRPSVLAYSPDGRTLAQGSDDISVLLWDVTGLGGKGRPKPAELSPKELQVLWEDLARPDAAAAYRAMVKLAAGSRQSIPFFGERLRPVAPVDARAVARWVADLDSDRFETRDESTRQLEKLKDLAEHALRQALKEKTSLEKRRRIDRLLEKLGAEREQPPPDRLRTIRALETLERMDTPEARRVLERLAEGAPHADLTVGAKGALRRLSKRPAASP